MISIAYLFLRKQFKNLLMYLLLIYCLLIYLAYCKQAVSNNFLNDIFLKQHAHHVTHKLLNYLTFDNFNL